MSELHLVERRTFESTDINTTSIEVAEWLGCKPEFISSSFDLSTQEVQKRNFERYHVKYATVLYTKK